MAAIERTVPIVQTVSASPSDDFNSILSEESAECRPNYALAVEDQWYEYQAGFKVQDYARVPSLQADFNVAVECMDLDLDLVQIAVKNYLPGEPILTMDTHLSTLLHDFMADP